MQCCNRLCTEAAGSPGKPGGFQDLARQSLAWPDLVLAIGPLWEGGQTRCPPRSFLTHISMKYYITLQVNWVTNISCLLYKMLKEGQTVSSVTVLSLMSKCILKLIAVYQLADQNESSVMTLLELTIPDLNLSFRQSGFHSMYIRFSLSTPPSFL